MAPNRKPAAKPAAAQAPVRRPPRQQRAPGARRTTQRASSLAPLRVSSHDKLASAKFGRSALESVVAAIADPDNHPAVRFPGSRKTFVNKIRSVSAFTGSAAAQGLQANSGFVIAFRDVRCAKIVSEFRPAGQLSVYNLVPATASVNGAALAFVAVAGAYLSIAHTDYVSGWARHGTSFIPWIFKDGYTRIFVQSETGNQAALQAGGLTPVTSYTFNISWYFAGLYRQDAVTGTTDAGGNVSINLPAGRMGYIAIQTVSALNGATFDIADQSANAMRHLMLTDLADNLADIETLRVNAVSAMWSDRTAEQFAQGECVSYQASGSEEWAEFIQATPTTDASAALDPYSKVATFNDMHKGAFKKGRYLPLKPSEDPRERNYVQLGATEQSIAPIRYDQVTDYVYLGWNAGVLASGSGTTIGEVTVVHAVEGVSESQWRSTDVCRIPKRVFDDAVYVMAQVDADFENINHLSKLWNFFKRALPIAVNVADQIAPMLPLPLSGPVSAISRGARQFLPLLQ